jgi:hypothetical protein
MLEPKALADLDPVEVRQRMLQVASRVQEDNPRLNVSRGVFAKTLVGYHALLETQQQDLISRYLAGRSLQAMTDDPALADPTLVDDVLSNFRLPRKAGTKASGEIAIVVSNDVTVSIGAGAGFTADGRRYVTTDVYTAKAEAAQIFDATDRLLSATSDGNFVFTLPVESVDVGQIYQVKKNTTVVPEQLPPGYVNSYAVADFVAGTDAESNEALLDRMRQGSAARGGANRDNMEGMLREEDAFARFVRSSIVGMGSPEMLRDKHWIFPVGGGGRVDWYVRTAEATTTLVATLEATCISVSGGVGLWQLTIDREAMPGFYEVVAVRPGGSGADYTGTLPIEDEERGIDLDDVTWPPDLATADEAAYTRFQTAIVRFSDDGATAGLTAGTTRDFDVVLRGILGIDAVQDFVLSEDVRFRSSDLLVKAPVPCFVKVSVTIHKRARDAEPDLAAIRAAIRAAVHAVGFTGLLYSSAILDAVHDHLSGAASVNAVDMIGRIRYPSGRERTLRSATVLEIPNAPAEMTTARTAQFFADDQDIFVSVVNAIPAS